MPHSAPPRQTLPSGDFAPWEIASVKSEVRVFLARKDPRRRLNRDDVVQACLVAWWTQRRRYNAQRGASPRTFLKQSVRAALIDVLRRELAAKRGGNERPPRSLDGPLNPHDPDSGSLAESLVCPDTDMERQVARRALTHRFDELRSQLTPAEARLLDQLRAGTTLPEFGRAAGIPVTTLRSQRKALLRKLATDELREFL